MFTPAIRATPATPSTGPTLVASAGAAHGRRPIAPDGLRTWEHASGGPHARWDRRGRHYSRDRLESTCAVQIAVITGQPRSGGRRRQARRAAPDCRGHLVDLGHAVHRPQQALGARSRAGSARSGGGRRRAARARSRALSSARRMNSVPPQTSQTPATRGRLEAVVVAGAALGAGEAAGDALDQRRRRRPSARSPRRASVPCSASIRSSASACGTVRGKPSRMKPLRAVRLVDAARRACGSGCRRRPARPAP